MEWSIFVGFEIRSLVESIGTHQVLPQRRKLLIIQFVNIDLIDVFVLLSHSRFTVVVRDLPCCFTLTHDVFSIEG